MQPMISISLLSLAVALAACTDNAKKEIDLPLEAKKPSFAIDQISELQVDGINDDLVSAGLTLNQLRTKLAPAEDSANPTASELRRGAYHQNYQSLLALAEQDGYGQAYAQAMQTDNLVAGSEYLLPVRYSDHSIAAMLMVQVPTHFDGKNPCLVVTASSGSRGIYGAVGVVGAWALHQGCAVASTDKGTGTGFHWLTENLAQSTTGQVKTGSAIDSHFHAKGSSKLDALIDQYPHRIATKHAHSGKKIEQEWGQFTLQAAQLGFYVLNQYHRDKQQAGYFTRANTLTLGAAISNGGAAVLQAAELDQDGWLDAIVVSEPNVFLPSNFSYRLNGATKTTRSLPHRAIEYALYGACASLAETVDSPLSAMQLPYFTGHFANRCEQLKNLGLIQGEDQQALAQAALVKMQQVGLAPEAHTLLMTSSAIGLWESIAVNYTNSYLGSSVEDHLCQLSYAFVDQTGQPIATPEAVRNHLFASSSGIIPTSGLHIINDQSQEGPRSLYFSKNQAGQLDYGLTNMLCLKQAINSPDFDAQVNQLAFSGDLHGKPALIVQGGSDNLIDPSQHSRAYLDLNYHAEGNKSQLRYIEVDRGQHFDAFLNYPPLRTYYTPLHGFFEQALDIMLAHLNSAKPLPPSQRILTEPLDDMNQSLAKQPDIALNGASLNGLRSHRAITIDKSGVTISE
ncbi:3-hydroxybutyrate oligomer hydrolase family protein [Simiduia curdlanivorans]|uniref:3-hydroxybutyrate oligomer hydrolase family protein n=1 Tax=Simiduia curdlanivorans TaxID=1492769 RepID=A0ABV8V338_9GAMM|nr:3-hydroxybutyrate oligomer hydrolase family protein [Simiduia curdlanivorans]MDN3640111.1 3-hydroxybutyrate oligomer hydrolase family protein [Simiduia curdlanivorans]